MSEPNASQHKPSSATGTTTTEELQIPTLEVNHEELQQKLFKDVPPVVVDTPPKTMGDLINVFARHKGVVAVMLMNRQGLIIKSTNEERGFSGFYCGFAKQILDNLVDAVEDVNPSRIQVIRVASGIQELLISPIEDMDMVFVILQNIRDRPADKNLCFLDPKHKAPPPSPLY